MTDSHVLAYRPTGHMLLIAGRRLVIMLPSEQSGYLADLWRIAAEDSGMDDLLEWLVDRGFRTFASLTAVEFAEAGPVRVLLRGSAQLHVTESDGATRTLDGQERRTWLDAVLPVPAAIDTDPDSEVGASGLPLAHGVALASGFAWPAQDGITHLASVEASGAMEPAVPAGREAPPTPGPGPAPGPPAPDPGPPAPEPEPDTASPAPEPEPDPAPPALAEPEPITVVPIGEPTPSALTDVSRAEDPSGEQEPTPAPDETWHGLGVTIDPFASLAEVPPPVIEAPTGQAIPPIAVLPDLDPFEQVFGATRKGTVERAAVREEDAPEPEDGADATAGGTSPASQRQGDHDGRTISAAELARLRGQVGTRPAAAAPDQGEDRVRAAICDRGHPNPPNQARCRVCGADLSNSVMQTVPRPVVGYLVFDDGQQVALEGTVIVGRAPKAPMTPRAAVPVLVTVHNPEISRSHIEVQVEGWSATVVDLDSTNGTKVTLPGEKPRLLRQGEPCLITPGTLLLLGDEVSARYQVAP